jgi:hypothetical protein
MGRAARPLECKRARGCRYGPVALRPHCELLNRRPSSIDISSLCIAPFAGMHHRADRPRHVRLVRARCAGRGRV